MINVKSKSNRPTARSRPGPRTAAGRARSAKNSLRHGLSLPVLADPVLSKEVAALARQVSGADAGEELQGTRGPHCRSANRSWPGTSSAPWPHLARAGGSRLQTSASNWNNKVTIALRVIARGFRGKATPEEEVRLLFSVPEGPEKLVTILTEIAKRLPALDRYERRALARRNVAIRAFDAAQLSDRSSLPEPQ